jgi:RimJ/RimL family protein N-acetyltransferase
VTTYDLGLPIETEWLTIRAVRPEDGDDIYAIYADPEVSRYLYTEPMDRAAGRRYAAERTEPVVVKEGDGVNLAAELRGVGRVVATMYVHLASVVHSQGEVGYVVSPEYAGRGLATEGAAAMLAIGFDRWDLHRMIGRCDARNAASAAVLRKLGMREEALFRENEWVKGEWTDEQVFAILAEDWRAAATAAAAPSARSS